MFFLKVTKSQLTCSSLSEVVVSLTLYLNLQPD